MYLGDGCSRDGLRIELGEHFVQRAPEFTLNACDDLAVRGRRHLVAALDALGNERWREEAFACADDLQELDKGRSELLGGNPDPTRDPCL